MEPQKNVHSKGPKKLQQMRELASTREVYPDCASVAADVQSRKMAGSDGVDQRKKFRNSQFVAHQFGNDNKPNTTGIKGELTAHRVAQRRERTKT